MTSAIGTTSASASSTLPPAASTPSNRAGREQGNAGDPENAVRGQVRLGDEQRGAGQEQRDDERGHRPGLPQPMLLPPWGWA